MLEEYEVVDLIIEYMPSSSLARDKDDNLFLIVSGWGDIKAFTEALKKRQIKNSFEEVIEEHMNWGFSDEYVTCYYCNRAICTTLDSAWWVPDFWHDDYGTYCGNCTRTKDEVKEIYLEHHLINNSEAANTILSISQLYELGFALQNDSYGYSSNIDNPKTQFNELSGTWEEVLFHIKSMTPFEVQWHIFVRGNKKKQAV